MKLKLLAGAALLSVLAVPVVAQEMAAPKAPQTRAEVEAKVKERFAKADANRDGAITQAEIDAGREKMRTEMRARHFDTLDANKDGSITRAEFDASHEARKAKRAERGEGKGPGAMGHRGGHHGKRMMRGAGGGMFTAQDANKDGKVTLAEATTKALARFDAVDANKDGSITAEERKAHREKMRSEWRAKRADKTL